MTEGERSSCPAVYYYMLVGGTNRSLDFAKKFLAEFAVNVGLACGNCCTYCSSRPILRCQPDSRILQLSRFEQGYPLVATGSIERVGRDARRMKKRGLWLWPRHYSCTAKLSGVSFGSWLRKE